MKRFVVACLSSAVFASSLGGQDAVPEIAFTASADVVKLPAGRYFGEVAGIAMNSKRHLFVFSRTGQRSTVHGASAAQLFEFGPDGSFIREIGQDLSQVAACLGLDGQRDGEEMEALETDAL